MEAIWAIRDPAGMEAISPTHVRRSDMRCCIFVLAICCNVVLASDTHPPVEALMDALDVEGELGFQVFRILSGGPAERAGLAVGDLIVQVEGSPFHDIQNSEGLVDFLAPHRGQQVQITFLRGGELETTLVQVDPHPLDPNRPTLGVMGATIVRVTRVTPDGRGGRLGLQEGDVLPDIDWMTDAEQVRRSVDGTIELAVARDGTVRTLKEPAP
jgi:S1-C subfamily serine protease